jgi:dTDP-4-amino-4,6-dideoxy-D-galactose acyltransferase
VTGPRSAALCEILEWDSTFFGRRVARYLPARCTDADLDALAAECAERRIECVYILIDPSDTESIVSLNRGQAFFADVRLTFGMPIAASPPASSRCQDTRVRPAKPSDVPMLRTLATASHRHTRFQADPHFPAGSGDRLYETWIENSCRGYADAVLVAQDAASAAMGYVTCHRDAPDRGRIGLFAVADDYQGRGVGGALVAAAIDWFAANGVTSMTVSTQLRNARAIRVYERAGLILSGAGFWFHYWPER